MWKIKTNGIYALSIALEYKIIYVGSKITMCYYVHPPINVKIHAAADDGL